MEMVTIEDAAKRGRVSTATIWRWLQDGRLQKYRRPGDKRVYLDGAEVDRAFVFVPATPEDAAVQSLLEDVTPHLTKEQLARMKRIMGVKSA